MNTQGRVAELVQQSAVNRWYAGSSPVSPAILLLSSSGQGCWVLSPETGVRLPIGVVAFFDSSDVYEGKHILCARIAQSVERILGKDEARWFDPSCGLQINRTHTGEGGLS